MAGWDIARGLAGAGSGGGSTERLTLEPEVMSDGWGTYYNQRDARWAATSVGPSIYPVSKIGCLLADLAMVGLRAFRLPLGDAGDGRLPHRLVRLPRRDLHHLDGGGTHFVTLTGLDRASDYWTDDPWEQNAMHVTFSGDWFDRGPVYEAIDFT